MRIKPFTFLSLLLLMAACTKKSSTETVATPEIGYNVVNSFPHDTSAFTEGLLIHQGQLYESTGEKESWIGVVNITNGKVDRKVQLAQEFFGEGITVLNNKVYQLTWKTQKGFIYDLKNFNKLGEFTYKMEGWGMTTDGKSLVMSDGTEKLYFMDTVSMKVTRTLVVRNDGVALTSLNELEYVNGFIFANVWRTDTIVKIDIATGNVVGQMNLGILTSQAKSVNPGSDVLNGIAWHPDTKLMLVTGKYWPYIYVLKLKAN